MSKAVKLTLAMIAAAFVILVAALALTSGGSDDETGAESPAEGSGQTEPGADTGTDSGDDSGTDSGDDSGSTVPESAGTALADPPLVREDSPVLSAGTETTFVEFLDFDCPACASVHPQITALREQYGDRVGFVVRYIPLHANSLNGFRAAEAARAQGKYAEMVDLLFERQQERSVELGDEADPAPFREYAEELGLDMDKFDADFSSDHTSKLVEQSMADAEDLGVQGTPTFFIGGEQQNPETLQDLADALDAALD